jgi:hypothetical protein
MSSQVPFVSPGQFRRRRLGLFLTVVGCLAAGVGVAGYQLTPPSEPIPPTTPADVRKADRPESLRHPYISFQCKKVVDSGVVKEGRGVRRRSHWKAYYYLLAVEDRWIVATSDKEIRAGQVQGRIVQWDMPVNQSALKQVYANLSPRDQAKILPVQLNVGDYTDPPTITGAPLLFVVVGIAGGVCLLVGLYKFATSFSGGVPEQLATPQWSYPPPQR